MKNYKTWKTFNHRGIKFIALERILTSEYRIFDEEMNSYGAFQSIKEFKEFYDTEGSLAIVGNHLK